MGRSDRKKDKDDDKDRRHHKRSKRDDKKDKSSSHDKSDKKGKDDAPSSSSSKVVADYSKKALVRCARDGVMEIAEATYEFKARADAEISFERGDFVEILKKTETVGWWKGRLKGSSTAGLFPSNYVKIVVTGADLAAYLKRDKVDDKRSSSSPRNKSSSKHGKSAKLITIATALFDFDARKPEEISIRRGDEILVVEKGAKGGWWKGQSPDGKSGLFPSNYCQVTEKDASKWKPQGYDPKTLAQVSNLRAKLKEVDTKIDAATSDLSDDGNATGNESAAVLKKELARTQALLRTKERQVTLLEEKLRIAEELIESLDAMTKQGSKRKEKNKFWKRQSSKF